MSVDPYKAGLLKDNTYFAKTDIVSRLVVVLQCTLDNRTLRLIPQQSRAVRKHEVHELIMTDEPSAGPNKEVNRVGYFGFVEILEGGVIIKGDEVLCDGELIGHIAGFDETHMPNHQNIVIIGDNRATGAERGVLLNAKITFRHVVA